MNRRRTLTKSFALRRGACRGGFSLVELLVASGIGLVVMAAVGQLFGIFGRGVSQGQARVEANSRLRNVTWRLRQDLVGRTAPPQRLVLVDSNSGYLQVMAGPSPTVDILALTTSVPGSAFGGRLDGAKGYESPVAEVAWFCDPDTGNMHQGQQLYNLHRRQLLVAAAPDAGAFDRNVFAAKGTSDLAWAAGQATSLGDLTKPANRFWTTNPVRKLQGLREGEDVVLRGVLAFDVKLLDLAGPVDGAFDTTETGPADQFLRGIEIRIRYLDPAANQPREVRVSHAF